MRTVKINDNRLYRSRISCPLDEVNRTASFEVERLDILESSDFNDFKPWDSGIGIYCWVREEHQLCKYPVEDGIVSDYAFIDRYYIFSLPEVEGIEFISKQKTAPAYDEVVFCLDYRDGYNSKPFQTYLACRKFTDDYNKVLNDVVVEEVEAAAETEAEADDNVVPNVRYIGFSRNNGGFMEVFSEDKSSWIYTEVSDEEFDSDLNDLKSRWKEYDEKVSFRDDAVFFQIFGFERNCLNDLG